MNLAGLQQMKREGKKIVAVVAWDYPMAQIAERAGVDVAKAVSIPVLGGLGGGPWLDGRIRMVHAAIGYAASNLNSEIENYANVAQVTLEAITAYAEDVRAGRQVKGQRPA